MKGQANTNGGKVGLLLVRIGLLLLAVGIAPVVIAQESRPNILWLSCEDISPYLSMYGDSSARTPNLDRLASEATIYTNAFATVAVCAPNRSSIITGMYPTSIGTMHMRTGKDVMSWGLREYSGESKAVDINGDPVPLYAAVIPAHVKCFTEYLRAAGYYCTNNEKTDYQFAAPPTAWDDNGSGAHWRNRARGQPFFAVFNYGVTHESRIWRNMNLPQTVSPANVPLPAYFPDDSVVRNDIARNYSNIELLDKQIGERLQELEEDGLLGNTIIFFFSDHGGPLPKGKRENYETGLKTPLIIRKPDNLIIQYDDRLVSHVDFAPTILTLAGIPVPEYMQGQAFLGEAEDAERKYIFASGDRFDEHTDRMRVVRDDRWLYVRNYHPELPAYKDNGYRKNMNMMVRLLEMHSEGKLNSDQEYWFRENKTEEELYDCFADPENLHNIIGDAVHAGKADELRRALDAWLSETGDMAVVPEKEMYLQMWPGGIQPVTQAPEIKISGDYTEITCATEGASVGYIITGQAMDPDLNAAWKVYHGPFKVKMGQVLYVIAQRIGYRESEIMIRHY